MTTRRTWLTRLASFFGAAAAAKALPVPAPPFFDEPCTLATPEQVAERMRPGLPLAAEFHGFPFHFTERELVTLATPEDVADYERATGQRHRIGTTLFSRKPARFEPWP